MFKWKKPQNKTVDEDIIIASFKRESREIPDSAHQICAIFSELFPFSSSAS